MQIATNTVVSLDYTLKNAKGEVLESSGDNRTLTYLHGHDNLVPGLEKALEGSSEGDELSVVVSPEEGYGQYRDDLVQKVPMAAFEGVGEVKPGMRFHAEAPGGPVIVTVRDVSGEEVTVDANHELAGQDLHFDVEVKNVRAATNEEIEHGQVQEQVDD